MDNILKTGTTTIGIVCKDCIVLGADKRATAGNFIANKNVEKVVPISDYMALTTAGTVSDIQLLIKLIKAELKLKEIRSNQKPSVKEGANLLAGMVFSNIRKMSMIPGISHFLVGGYDDEKHLYDLYPDGSISDVEDFVSSGSGSVMAYGVLETNYKENMSEEEGINLTMKALNAAIQRDSASGEGIDIFVIDKKGIRLALKKKINTKLT
ncbi:MAG: proteasome subunit beta [Nanoarchaeota archaeon]|nr:proteasome subunit beta [Nanoarchaeota archaeon]MBU1270252.1 proteasome subunit beta [Nanoarchaeota archaeon]MBU1604836.1 proteasome subunit beta [Nanoarchaeota archaeon]MBU2442494.1 proteasome subunit beta [Nanoarchaeota archaeon]